MIDKLEATLPGFTLNVLLDRIKSPVTGAESLEISFDQQYGLRIIAGPQWTEIQFREAGTWTAPQDSRALVRNLRGEG
jgi:hypothetical protein